MGSVVEMSNDRIGELEDKSRKFTSSKQRENKLVNNQQRVRDSNSNKRANICINEASEKEERVYGVKILFKEIMVDSSQI